MASGDRKDWTDKELDLIVADYFAMLNDEIRQTPYDKTQHRRVLMNLIDRSNSSIEFKHHNISAVLQQLDLPWINGYKPRAHFQKTIIDAIDRFLSHHPAAQHPEALASGLAERPQLFIEPAPKLEPKLLRPEAIQRLVRKFNPAERDFLNRKLGHNARRWCSDLNSSALDSWTDPTSPRRFDGYPGKMGTALAMISFPLIRGVVSDFLK